MSLRKKAANNLFNGAVSQKTLHKNLEFTASEQYRLLRTNIMFTLPENVRCPIIGVTSSIRGEGKSTTAINLSYVLAEKGSRVLLIDGDLRIPSVAKKLEMENKFGLTNLLLGEGARIVDWQTDIHPNWYILPSGDIPPNPSELLGSQRMENLLNSLKDSFDFIIIDLPPVNSVSDAMSVANLITGIILVVREDYTSKREIDQCFRQIQLSNVNVLGCVMNESGNGLGAYGKYKKNRYYKYYYRYYQTYEASNGKLPGKKGKKKKSKKHKKTKGDKF